MPAKVVPKSSADCKKLSSFKEKTMSQDEIIISCSPKNKIKRSVTINFTPLLTKLRNFSKPVVYPKEEKEMVFTYRKLKRT
jgi:hypothetical protein